MNILIVSNTGFANMSMKDAESVIKELVHGFINEFDNRPVVEWGGDIIDLSDYKKDCLCFAFLKNMPSWWDDIVPPVIVNQQEFIEKLYVGSDCIVTNLIRNDVYLYLEDRLREMVQEAWDVINNVQPEPFEGYSRGQ